jgi:predicted transcriptional regulator
VLKLATNVVSAYLSNNQIPADGVPALLKSIYGSLSAMDPSAATAAERDPAVPIKKSVTDEYIVCLEDGKKLRTLKRYLRSHFNLSTEEYRAKWHLPRDYPMTAPSYTRLRSQFAKKIGLGRKPTGSKPGRRRSV